MMIPPRPSNASPGMSGVDPKYHDFYHKAQQLQDGFHSRLEDPFNPAAMSLKRKAEELVSDIGSGRSPTEIEERIKAIQGDLYHTRDFGQNRLMSNTNHEFFNNSYARMRTDIRRLPGQNQQHRMDRGYRPWL
jgi:hypothetical protein